MFIQYKNYPIKFMALIVFYLGLSGPIYPHPYIYTHIIIFQEGNNVFESLMGVFLVFLLF